MAISKKLLVVCIGLGLAFLGYVLIALIPIVGPFYVTLIGALTALVGLYFTGNVAAQHVQAKQDTDKHVATVNATAGQPAPLPGTPEAQKK